MDFRSLDKIVKEFHEREDYVFFPRAQIQEKEKELKGEYKLLKEAKKQSGAHWDGKTDKITAAPALWNNIISLHPRAKKFRSKAFPLFEALRELYDGQTAEGTYNYTSTQQHQHPDPTQVESGDELGNKEVVNLDFEETTADHEEDDEADYEENDGHDQMPQRRDDVLDQMPQRRDDVHGQRPQRRVAAVPRNREEKEPKRQKKTDNLKGLMGRYIGMRTKQAEEEAAQLAREREQKEAELAREREASQANDFSIKKCISVLGIMEVTKEEKVKAYIVFKDSDNR